MPIGTQYRENTLIEWYDRDTNETLNGVIIGYVKNTGETLLPVAHTSYIVKDALGDEFCVSLNDPTVKKMVQIPDTHFMGDHEERVNFIFDTIETHDNPPFALHFLIEACGSKEEWDFDFDTITPVDYNKLYVKKTALFMQHLIETSGCEKAREIMSKPFKNKSEPNAK